MTRINCVPPALLVKEHLLAEYRELPRIFRAAKRIADVPPTYRMGAGHMKFFYDKLLYCEKRYQLLCDEMIKRGFTVNYTKLPVNPDRSLYNDWKPDNVAIAINLARINERLVVMGYR